MKKSEQKLLRRELENMALRLQPDVRAITERELYPSGGKGTTELSNTPLHLADGGTKEYMHELDSTLLENEDYLLSEVRAALARLEEGSYGRCQQCRKKISLERLRALPHARLCLHCAEASPQGPEVNLNVGRPESPADTLADEEEMEIRGRNARSTFSDMATSQAPHWRQDDSHAAGVPGGGSAAGGLAGANKGDGAPDLHELQEAMGSGEFDADEADDESAFSPRADHAGGSTEKTPARR